MNSITHVPQPRYDGCGISCLAMVAGISYKKALKVIFGYKSPKRHVVDISQLSKALKKLGFTTEDSNSFRNKKAYAAILGFWWEPNNPRGYNGHFIVYNPKTNLFLDPDPIPWMTRQKIIHLWRCSGKETLLIYKEK